MKRLLTCMGEILVDFLPIQEHGKTIGFHMRPGGAPFNVAVGMARLGRPVAFAAKISSDLFGRYLRDYLQAQGIDPRFLVGSDAPTTLAFVTMEGGEPAFAFYGEGAADTRLTAEELPQALFEETAIFHCGSISLLRGTTPLAVLSTALRLKGRALISFDPNLRPGLVRDEPAYRGLLARFFLEADVIKMSSADLQWLVPGKTAQDALADLRARFAPPLIVVTQGSGGATAVRGDELWAVPAFQVKVVDTVGAGDSFSAGLLARLADYEIISRQALQTAPPGALKSCLCYAAAASAITCTRAGADPPTRPEVERFLAGQPN